MVQLLLQYLFMVALGPVFIFGWYIITRGYYDIGPDGSLVKKGKLLKDWSLFWEDIISYRKVYYNGAQLKNKLNDLISMNHKYKLRLSVNQGEYSLFCQHPLSEEDLDYIRNSIMVEIFVKGQDVFLYSEYPQYRFSEWVRNPLSACPPCMSSVYGSLFWWIMYFVSVNLFKFDCNFAGWCVLWPFYIVSLVCINHFINKKL